MKLHSRPPTIVRPKKRLGLGYGSGKGGHTSSRGQKGQKSRGSVRLSFTGSSWVWFKRLPFMRGKSRFGSLSPKLPVSLDVLETFKPGTVITQTLLARPGVRVKIVGSGKLTHKLIVQVPASRTAIKAIEKAGGEYRAQTE